MDCTGLKMNGNDNLNTKLPMFDDNNWNRLITQMRVLFDAQDILDLINDDYIPVSLSENAMDA